MNTDPLTDLGALLPAMRRPLSAAARREGLSPEDAVDAVQDALCAFVTLARAGNAPADRAAWPAFVRAMVTNAARNRRRLHHRARPHLPVESAPPDEEGSPAEMAERAEDAHRLRLCITRLCGPQRAVVTLRLLDERPGDDVADALGISRGYVDVLLHRAKAALRACMEDEASPSPSPPRS
ncbi:MAG: sigma-70 family RNA polymerase sigma factor [Polyangiales bacterium]